MVCSGNMSVSKQVINKNKHRLNRELSIIQLLFLVRKYHLAKQVDIRGGIYSHQLASLLSTKIKTEDIDTIIDEVNSINEDLISIESKLKKLSKKDLKYILRGIDDISYSYALLVKEVFLYIPLETIKEELKNFEENQVPIDNQKNVNDNTQSDNSTDNPNNGKSKSPPNTRKVPFKLRFKEPYEDERISNKKKLNALSDVQLLFLVQKYNLKFKIDFPNGISGFRIRRFLSENFKSETVDVLIAQANDKNIELNNLKVDLESLSKDKLRFLLRNVAKYDSSTVQKLTLEIFMNIPLETIKRELYEKIYKPTPPTAKKSLPNSEIETPISKPTDVSDSKSKTDSTEETICSESESKNISEINDENIKSKLLGYDESYLLDMLFNFREYFPNFKDLDREQFDQEIMDSNLSKDKAVELILGNVDLDVLINEYFNPIAYEFFPYNEKYKGPRDYQIETISQIYNAIEKGYKYIILEAVSGFGKSLIAATISSIYSEGKSYILTPTNQLLSPYTEEFKDLNLKRVFPRSKYICRHVTGDMCCSYFHCREENCRYFQNLSLEHELTYSRTCRYLYSLNEGLQSDAILCTYDYFFTEGSRRKNFLKPRKLLICDEGHNIDDLTANGCRLVLYDRTLKELNIDTEYEKQDLEVNKYYYLFLKKIKDTYEYTLKRRYLGQSDKRRYSKDFEKIKNFLSYFNEDDNNLVFKHVSDNSERENHRWEFYPVNTKKFIKDALFDYCETCIFMSSSIFDHENFAYDLGINKDEVFKINVPNIFDLSKNPIGVYNEFNMEYENIVEPEFRLKTIPIVEQIIESHKYQKGIIHTFSDECKDFLYNNLKRNNLLSNRLLTHNTANREDQLNKFKRDNRKLVFISSSMGEGVDLPGDLCEFQIIYKLPYPPSRDERIKKRYKAYEDGEEWYRYKMLTKLIQAYGRGVRFEGDSCETFILDNRILDVIEEDIEGNQIIPQYFIDAIAEYDGTFEEESLDEDDGSEALDEFLSKYL